jgi:beta-glucanase (GH16 family)
MPMCASYVAVLAITAPSNLGDTPACGAAILRAGYPIAEEHNEVVNERASDHSLKKSIDPNDLSSTADLTFSDEFTSPRLWDGVSGWDTGWSYSPAEGTAGYNNELQWYVKAGYALTSNIRPWIVRGGTLSITAERAAPPVKAILGREYTSGMINSFHQFSQTYGYFEIRMRLPAGKGFWPAFWLLPVADKSQEIDIVEFIGDQPRMLHNAVHSYATGALKTSGNSMQTDLNLSSGYHTYGMDWQADKISFYFDRRRIFEVATPSDMHDPMYMIANLAVGGDWPGEPDENTRFPSAIEIDYIRVYKAQASSP